MASSLGIPGFANKWYYNTESGQLTNASQALGEFQSGIAGWHELNIPGSDTGVQAVAEAKKEFPKGKTPSYSPVTPAKAAQTAASEAGAALPGWTNGLTSLLADITSEATWLRVAKVIVGSVMIIVGLAKITGADKAATTAAKGALL